MKELTIQDKTELYDKALKQIKECTPDENGFVTIYPKEIFPELNVSKDEKIRKELIKLLRNLFNNYSYFIKDPFYTECIAWLEKQGEQKFSWSKEDEKKRTLLMKILEVNHPHGLFKVNSSETMRTEKLVSWLESINYKI